MQITIQATQFQVNLTYDSPSFQSILFPTTPAACAAGKDCSYKSVAIDE